MGVYIKGMKMPKQCYDCYLVASDPDDEDKLYCKHLDEDIIDWCSRLENCPLVEVKEPHGRLVDLDALEKERDSIDCYGNSLVALEWDDDCIMSAPTIIESEE